MFSLALTALAYGTVMLGPTLAAAVPSESLQLERRIPPDNVAMYTAEGFLTSKPPPNSCLFYTAGFTEAAVNYGRRGSVERFTIWDIWDPAFYNRSQAVTNPLRDILKFEINDNPDTQAYFRHMSQAFAELCRGNVPAMTQFPRIVREEGIWGQVEKPTLQKTGNLGGQCDRIDACDTNGKDIPYPPYWVPPGSPIVSVVAANPTGVIVSDVQKASVATPMPTVTRRHTSPIAVLSSSAWTGAELAYIFRDIDPLW